MALTFELGISSATTVTILPTYAFKPDEKQIRSETRTRSGKLFEYKWGAYTRFKVPVEFVNGSDYSLINSWFDSRTQLLFFITSDSATEVHSVMIRNNETPLNMHPKPHYTLWKGTIVLETY